MTREEWLNQATNLLREDFDHIDASIPEKIRITYGLFQHDFYRDSNVLAVCCFHTDEDIEICISSNHLLTSLEVLVVLTHELVHAVVGHREAHEGRFPMVANSIGLTSCCSDWTQTTNGEILTIRFQEIIDKLGQYP